MSIEQDKRHYSDESAPPDALPGVGLPHVYFNNLLQHTSYSRHNKQQQRVHALQIAVNLPRYLLETALTEVNPSHQFALLSSVAVCSGGTPVLSSRRQPPPRNLAFFTLHVQTECPLVVYLYTRVRIFYKIHA